jgi:hypothetical protein
VLLPERRDRRRRGAREGAVMAVRLQFARLGGARAIGCAAALAVLASCGGEKATNVAPKPNTDVEVAMSTASVAGPYLHVADDGGPSVECQVDFVLKARGTGLVTWQEATFRVHDLRDTTRVLGAAAVGFDVLAQALPSQRVTDGQAIRTSWRFTMGAGYVAEFELRYSPGVGGASRITTAWFRCAPPSATNTALPAITKLTITPSAGTITSSTLLKIDVEGSTPAGALYTGVRITGPCVLDDGSIENFQPAVTRTFLIRLPYPCQLGVPVGVDVILVDARANAGTEGGGYPLVLADTEPPMLTLAFETRPIDRGDYTVPSGDYYPPDTLLATARITDDYVAAGTLRWNVLPYGVSDSVIVQPLLDAGGIHYQTAFFLVAVPLQPAWVGTKIQIQFQARDTAGNFSQIFTTPADSIRLLARPVDSTATSSRVARGRQLSMRFHPATRSIPRPIRTSTSSPGFTPWPSTLRAPPGARIARMLPGAWPSDRIAVAPLDAHAFPITAPRR